MNRAQILWLQCIIAVGGAGFWLTPPHLPYFRPIAMVSALWALLTFSAIRLEGLEDWAHRATSFFGFLLCTIEGILGSLGLTGRSSGLLVLALLHGFTFLLAVVGKYQSKLRARPRRSLDLPSALLSGKVRPEQSTEEAPAEIKPKQQ